MLLPHPPVRLARLRKTQLSLFLLGNSEPSPTSTIANGPPGAGWIPVPGSKAGGYHRRKGKRYEYWYPGDAVPRIAPHERDSHAAHPPGAGWEAIPGSTVGGWHRQKGGASHGQKEYWYPGDASPRSAPLQRGRGRATPQQQGLLPAEDATLSRLRTKARDQGYPWESVEPLASFVVQHGTEKDAARLTEILREHRRDHRFGVAVAPAVTTDSRALTFQTWYRGGPAQLRETLHDHLRASRLEGQGTIFVITRSGRPEVEPNAKPVDWEANKATALSRGQRDTDRAAAKRAAAPTARLPEEADYWHQDGEEVRVIRDADHYREVYGDKPLPRWAKVQNRLLVQARRPGERTWAYLSIGGFEDPANAQRFAEDYAAGRIPRWSVLGTDAQGRSEGYPYPRTVLLDGQHVPVNRLGDWYEPPWHGKSPAEEAELRSIYANGGDFDIWTPSRRLPAPPSP